MNESTFHKLVLSPAGVAHAGLAIAAARAGGVGVLDLALLAEPMQGADNFRELLAATARGGRIGLRVSADQVQALAGLLALADERALELVLSGPAEQIASCIPALRAMRGQDRIYAEIGRADDADTLAGLADALIACGQEAAGWGGEDSSFILAQKLLSQGAERPLLIRGGIGLNSAAAVSMAGACGVVLDDQVLLLKETFLGAREQALLARLDGSETRVYGHESGCRLYAAPGSAAGREAERIAPRHEAGELPREAFVTALNAAMGWAGDSLLPIGQAVGLASEYRRRFGRVGKLLQALDRQCEMARQTLAETSVLDEGAPLAASHGTRYPIAQGPMTRVSDSPAFAHAVAQAGALPFLALALMRAGQVDELLADTARQMGDAPWGVGILGFVPQALREEQCQAVFRHKPSYALIAGGRPDQAAEFEARGIPAYLHAPVPALLRLYLEQGARRFVFEGRECGGHIGPLASFPLWEQMVEVLLTEVAEQDAADVHVLFAGGIGDAESAAMLAVLAAPLAARGIKVGVLMGTAYLFTDEIVSSGAVVAEFQQQALACDRTRSLETGPGHATRCADTPFAAEFARTRRGLLQSGAPAEQIRDTLEDLNLGRLRVAAKGRDRGVDGTLLEIAEDRQRQDGMYMIGQVATRCDRTLSVAELHRQVSEGAAQRLKAWSSATSTSADAAQPSDIAIIGIGMVMPKADEARDFWGHVLNQRSTITEVPRDRWDQALYFDPDKSARDKVYAKWGGFLDEIVFDPVSFGIAPSSMKSIDPMQLLSLEVTARALRDAQLGDDFDRENTSIILGAGGGIGDLGLQLGLRSELPRFVEQPDEAAWDRLPEWTNESFAGVLLNVAAGRVANRLDFGGVNFTVDAACGSSLAAITLATQELESGRSNLAIAGGVDTVQGPFGYLCFAKTQALSPQGRARVFDQDADGIVISEGVCVVVMKRLADAERDGDRIYATIKAAAGSSDGKALGLTAPLPKGQKRALDRAYRKAGFSPASLGLVEAHGTGTAVGDLAEAETITGSLVEAGAAPGSVALGSVKSLVGHTKCAAGVTGLVKVALALHHRVLPGHAGVERPLEVIARPDSPVSLLKQARPWLTRPDMPRRAAVSAFGFGGTNFHAVLEEYRPGWGADAPAGAADWPAELVLLRAADVDGLRRCAADLGEALGQGQRLRLADIAASCALAASRQPVQGPCACLVVRSHEDLREQLTGLVRELSEGADGGQLWRAAMPARAPRVAVLFPGQGAQTLGMGQDSAVYIEELRGALERADAQLAGVLQAPLSSVMWPASVYDPAREAEQRQRLTDTRFAQPALGVVALGYWRWLQRLGLRPQAAAGHSYGEYAALMAAGVLSEQDFLALSARRGAAMARAAGQEPAGAMAAVSASRDQVESLIANIPDLGLANHNGPAQSVITGTERAVEAALAAAQQAGISAQRLPVSGAFHSPLMASAQAELSAAIDAAEFGAASFTVYSNRLGAAYPDTGLAEELKQHLLSPVEFVREIQAMHGDGIELFLELGPKSILSNLVERILPPGAARTVAVEPAGQGLAGALGALAELILAGVALDPLALFEGRDLQALPLETLSQHLRPPPLSRTAWFVAGGYARAQNSEVRGNGRLPALDAHSKHQAIESKAAAVQAAPASAPAPSASPQAGPMPSAAAPAASALSEQALLAYQQTMRQFLALQEQVMRQALGELPSAGGDAQAWAAPAAATTSLPVSPQAAPTPAPASPPEATAPAADTIAEPVSASTGPVVWDAEHCEQVLIEFCAERTGYPPDMLDLDADLEADLGVDSIKRVELVGALQKRVPESLAAAMQAELERYTRARSLRSIIEGLIAASAQDTADVAAPQAAAAMEAAKAPAAAPDLRAVLLALVAERTGYPEDMLDADANLEADLGVDSIKRVEIVGALQKQLPTALASAMQARLDHFTRAPSLNELLARIAALEADAAAPDSAAPEIIAVEPAAQSQANMRSEAAAESVAEESPEATPRVPRYVIHPRELPAVHRGPAPQGLVLLAGGPAPVREALAERLREAGAEVVEWLLQGQEDLAGELNLARQSHGALDALVYLEGLEPRREDDLAAFREAGQAVVGQLFAILQALGEDPGELRLMAASRLGGTLGREADGPGPLSSGGLAGLINCYRAECPQVRARLVDFNGQADDSIAARLFDELCADDGLREVGYIGDTRYGVETRPATLQDTAFAPHLEPRADWVVLATGGARGITPEILLAMAQPGMRCVLLGRTPRPDPEALYPHCADAAAIKQALLDEARTRKEKPRPVELDRACARILAGREVHGNLERLAAAGLELRYISCDVRDEAAMQRILNDIYADYGRIDGVIHAAGIIEDKLIVDKGRESFRRVFATKTEAAQILARHLRVDELRWLALFSSVAGRYGNRGQADYAAANEVLNRQAWAWSRAWPQVRVMSINWGPWEAGMASEAVQARFREQGIWPIPLAAGARSFLDELAFGPKSEVELVIGAGPWAEYDQAPELAPVHRTPLLRVDLHIGAGGALVLDHHFTLARDPYLADHSMDGRGVLPATAAAEWMAEVAAAGWPGTQVAEITDLKVLAGVVLDPEQGRQVEFRARASSHSGPHEQLVSVEIVDRERTQKLYQATVRLVDRLPDAPTVTDALPQGEPMAVDMAYREQLFHGPRFRLISRIDAVGPEGVCAQVELSSPHDWIGAPGQWLFDPGLLDCGPQLAILWSRSQLDMTALPSAIGAIRRYGHEPLGGGLQARLRVRAQDGSALRYDVDFVDEAGRLRLSLRDVQGTASRELNRLALA